MNLSVGEKSEENNRRDKNKKDAHNPRPVVLVLLEQNASQPFPEHGGEPGCRLWAGIWDQRSCNVLVASPFLKSGLLPSLPLTSLRMSDLLKRQLRPILFPGIVPCEASR